MAKNDSVELELELVHTTEDTYLLTDGDIEAWVPRSLVESIEETDEEDMYIVTMPEWLAIEKGFT